MGAVQFSELDRLLVKENEPKYILITTNNLEQGYLAVTYLAAGFNRKHGIVWGSGQDACPDGTQTKLTKWNESPAVVPIIMERELSQFSSDGNNHDIFAANNFFMQGNSEGHASYTALDEMYTQFCLYCFHRIWVVWRWVS